MRSWERIEASRKAGAKPSADPLVRPNEAPEPKKSEAWASSGRSFGDVKRPFSSPKSVTESPPTSGASTALATTAEGADAGRAAAAERAFAEAKAKASPDELARMEKLRIGAEDLKSMSEVTKGLRKRILTVGEASDGADARGRPPAGAQVVVRQPLLQRDHVGLDGERRLLQCDRLINVAALVGDDGGERERGGARRVGEQHRAEHRRRLGCVALREGIGALQRFCLGR